MVFHRKKGHFVDKMNEIGPCMRQHKKLRTYSHYPQSVFPQCEEKSGKTHQTMT